MSELRTHPSAFLYLYMNGVRIQSVARRWWEIADITHGIKETQMRITTDDNIKMRKEEDGGAARLLNEIEFAHGDETIILAIRSWDETREHPLLRELEKAGRIRVTIETLE